MNTDADTIGGAVVDSGSPPDGAIGDGGASPDGAIADAATVDGGNADDATTDDAAVGTDGGASFASGEVRFAVHAVVESVSSSLLQGLLGFAPLSSGDLFVAGVFENTATFGPGEANETTLVSQGERDVFLARFSGMDGTLVWARSLGTSGDDRVDAVAAANGQAMLAMRFAAGTIVGASTAEAGFAGGAHIVRYDGSGTVTYSTEIGGDGAFVRGLAVASDNSFLVGGSVSSVAVFGPGEPNETTLDNSGSFVGAAGFDARYDSSGQLAWAHMNQAPSTTLSAANLTDGTRMFAGFDRAGCCAEGVLMGYMSAGGETWETSFGSPHSSDSPNTVRSLGDGALVAGTLSTTATFGAGEPNEATITGDAFIARYTSGGAVDWVEAADSQNIWYSAAAPVGPGFAWTGAFIDQMTFRSQSLTADGSGGAGPVELTDGFVALFAADRSLTWLRQIGGADFTSAGPVISTPTGLVCVLGGFYGEVSIDGPSPFLLSGDADANLLVACFQP